MSKVYERTENGNTTHVSIREGLDEVNTAMMEGKREVRSMSSGRGDHLIEYKDGRMVRLTEIDAPAEEPEQGPKAWTGEATRIATVKGKRYAVGPVVPAGNHAPGAYVRYWSERNGETFGATRSTNGDAKPGTVGRAIWDAVNR